jgi:hypothetical protein
VDPYFSRMVAFFINQILVSAALSTNECSISWTFKVIWSQHYVKSLIVFLSTMKQHQKKSIGTLFDRLSLTWRHFLGCNRQLQLRYGTSWNKTTRLYIYIYIYIFQSCDVYEILMILTMDRNFSIHAWHVHALETSTASMPLMNTVGVTWIPRLRW